MFLKIRSIITISFTLLVFNGYTQNDSTIYKNQLKFSPAKVFDIINPGIEISYEKRTGNFSTQVSASYLTDLLNITEYNQLKGFRINLEEKYFLNLQDKKIFRQEKSFQPYFSTNLAFANVSFKTDARFGIEYPYLDIYSNNYVDYFRVKKQTIVLNFKYGFQKIYHHFVIDFSFGLGLKYKNVKHFDRSVPEDKMEDSRHPNVFNISNKEMNGFTLNIPATIKVGYTF